MQSRGIGVRYLESEVFNKSVLDTFADCLGLLLTDWINSEWIRHLRILDVPMLVIGPNPCPAEVPTVNYDWEEAAFRLTHHFLDRGFRKIGLVNGERGWTPADQIYSGYCRALRERGMEAGAHAIFPGVGTSRDEIINYLLANPGFDALVIENQSAFLQSVWRMGFVPKLELGWIHTGSNPELQFPGVIATFPTPIMTFAGRIFLDHLVSQKPMPNSVSIPPSLFKEGRRIS
jgi:hypothetical protein